MTTIYPKQILKRITIIACGCIAFACDSGSKSSANESSSRDSKLITPWINVGGTSMINNHGNYTVHPYLPGGREQPNTWVDHSGNLWMFGGRGYDSDNSFGAMNDLWQYNTSDSQWLWKSGRSTNSALAFFGDKSVATSRNVPGSRSGSVSWVDSTGSLWLFGGYGSTTTEIPGLLNDLWQYNPTTSLWTWMGGSNTNNAVGIYGTKGQADATATNIPGARFGASSWVASNGNFFLFGGKGNSATASASMLNDLWIYDFNSSPNSWVWISGTNSDNQIGTYPTSTSSISSSDYTPSSRMNQSNWMDSSGNLWIFGGYGYDSNGHVGYLNDLWMFNPNTSEWTWVGGSNIVNSYDITIIGARVFSGTWFDQSGDLWIFGGKGDSDTNNQGYLNDFWVFLSGIQ